MERLGDGGKLRRLKKKKSTCFLPEDFFDFSPSQIAILTVTSAEMNISTAFSRKASEIVMPVNTEVYQPVNLL